MSVGRAIEALRASQEAAQCARFNGFVQGSRGGIGSVAFCAWRAWRVWEATWEPAQWADGGMTWRLALRSPVSVRISRFINLGCGILGFRSSGFRFLRFGFFLRKDFEGEAS